MCVRNTWDPPFPFFIELFVSHSPFFLPPLFWYISAYSFWLLESDICIPIPPPFFGLCPCVAVVPPVYCFFGIRRPFIRKLYWGSGLFFSLLIVLFHPSCVYNCYLFDNCGLFSVLHRVHNRPPSIRPCPSLESSLFRFLFSSFPLPPCWCLVKVDR